MESQTPSVDKIPFLENDTIVNVEISGYYHKFSQTLLVGLLSKYSEEERKKILDKLSPENPKAETFEESLILHLVILINTVETCAYEQKKIVYKTLDEFEKSLTTGN